MLQLLVDLVDLFLLCLDLHLRQILLQRESHGLADFLRFVLECPNLAFFIKDQIHLDFLALVVSL